MTDKTIPVDTGGHSPPVYVAPSDTLAAEGGRNWIEDVSHENGNYECRCCECGNSFIGHKRRVLCKVCSGSMKKWDAALSSPAPVVEAAKQLFEFDRYINGQKMAEGVSIHNETNLEDARCVAENIASKGPNGEVPVLVYIAPPAPAVSSYEQAIDEAMIIRHLGIAKGDAKAELNAIINWEVSVALDPSVSSAAQELIDRGRAEAVPAVSAEDIARFARIVGALLQHISPTNVAEDFAQQWHATHDEQQRVLALLSGEQKG